MYKHTLVKFVLLQTCLLSCVMIETYVNKEKLVVCVFSLILLCTLYYLIAELILNTLVYHELCVSVCACVCVCTFSTHLNR